MESSADYIIELELQNEVLRQHYISLLKQFNELRLAKNKQPAPPMYSIEIAGMVIGASQLS